MGTGSGLKIKRHPALKVQAFPRWCIFILDPDDARKVSPFGTQSSCRSLVKSDGQQKLNLKSCYRRKSPDEFAGLADGEPHWGRLWLTAGGKTDSYVSVSAPLFINTHRYIEYGHGRINTIRKIEMLLPGWVLINTHMHADIHTGTVSDVTITHTVMKPSWTLSEWKMIDAPRSPYCPAAHCGVLLFYQQRHVCLDAVKTTGGVKRVDGPVEWQSYPTVIIAGIRG